MVTLDVGSGCNEPMEEIQPLIDVSQTSGISGVQRKATPIEPFIRERVGT